jgi:hypothetical protein
VSILGNEERPCRMMLIKRQDRPSLPVLGSIVRPAVSAAGFPNFYRVENKSAHCKKNVDPFGYIHNLSSLDHRFLWWKFGFTSDGSEPRGDWEWRDGIAPRDPQTRLQLRLWTNNPSNTCSVFMIRFATPPGLMQSLDAPKSHPQQICQ